MSYKQFIPDIKEEWDEYWKKTSIEKELELTKTDGLRNIFNKYLPKKGKILEAGCGMGKWVINLDREGYDIHGVDENKYALKKLTDYYPKAKVKKADVKKTPFNDEFFDTYLSLGVVEHFEEGPQAVLKEAYRVLKKNGLAIVEVPYDSPLRKVTRAINSSIELTKTPVRIILNLLGIRKKRTPIKKRFYEYRYSAKELRNFMKEAGFNEIKILPKDDLNKNRSIALWLDYPKLQKINGRLFELNNIGILVKLLLNTISPFSYSALIVAVAIKK